MRFDRPRPHSKYPRTYTEYLTGRVRVTRRGRSYPAAASRLSLSRHRCDQRLLHYFWEECGQVAAECRDLPQERTADVRVLLLRHQKRGLDPRVEVAVHQRHGKLVLHVGK